MFSSIRKLARTVARDVSTASVSYLVGYSIFSASSVVFEPPISKNTKTVDSLPHDSKKTP